MSDIPKVMTTPIAMSPFKSVVVEFSDTASGNVVLCFGASIFKTSFRELLDTTKEESDTTTQNGSFVLCSLSLVSAVVS